MQAQLRAVLHVNRPLFFAYRNKNMVWLTAFNLDHNYQISGRTRHPSSSLSAHNRDQKKQRWVILIGAEQEHTAKCFSLNTLSVHTLLFCGAAAQLGSRLLN